jgi:single-stranded-DNA-specific exonuclease
LRALGWFDRHGLGEPNLARLLDLVALGTVADVVTLDSNNRILVAQGLVRMNRGNACAGIQALLQVAGRRQGRLTTSDLGYCVAPRLNAAGRLEDMSLGIECLLVDDLAAALDMAYRLDDLNRERRSIQADMQKQADAAIQTLHWEANALPKGLCLYNADWHQGVIGLVAARVKEQLHRPVIAFAAAGKGELKGSARSVPGLHIRDALDNIAARHPGLLSKFGGHAMAAGLSLAKSSYEEFSQSFDEEVSRWLSEDDLQGRVMSDGELAPEDFHLELAQLLRDAGPWGQGFPEPLFDGYFEVINKRVVGEKHLKLTLRLVGEKKSLEAIAFNAAPAGELPKWAQVHAAYRLDVNEYQGCRSLQLVIEHLEPAS